MGNWHLDSFLKRFMLCRAVIWRVTVRKFSVVNGGSCRFGHVRL